MLFVTVMAVVCCVRHSFQSHQVLHRLFLPVNKFGRQTALPCALTCWNPVKTIETWHWHALCHCFHIQDHSEHRWRRYQRWTIQSRFTHGTVGIWESVWCRSGNEWIYVHTYTHTLQKHTYTHTHTYPYTFPSRSPGLYPNLMGRGSCVRGKL